MCRFSISVHALVCNDAFLCKASFSEKKSPVSFVLCTTLKAIFVFEFVFVFERQMKIVGDLTLVAHFILVSAIRNPQAEKCYPNRSYRKEEEEIMHVKSLMKFDYKRIDYKSSANGKQQTANVRC